MRILNIFLFFLLFPASGSPHSTEHPTPTPRENLASYAKAHPVNSGNGVSREIHITDETVERIAGPKTTIQLSTETASTPVPSPRVEGKEYWIERQKSIKNRISRAQAGLEKTEPLIRELWDAFYHEDDPRRRDEVLGPRLSRMLRERKEFETELEKSTRDLEVMKIEARKKGALPGWFRENSAR